MRIIHHAVVSGFAAAILVAAGCGGPMEQDVAVPGSAATELTAGSGSTTAPTVEFVVYDGTSSPATVIAGCSEPTCMGAMDGSDPTPGTGTVTHPKNYVGWSVGGAYKGSIYLYVDGQKVASAKSGRLLVWNASPGAHVLQTMAYSTGNVAGWSPSVAITAE